MTCCVCLSNYAGPCSICPECLLTIYPHGATHWLWQSFRNPLAPAMPELTLAKPLLPL